MLRFWGRVALCAAPLGLAPASDGAARGTVPVCEVVGVRVEIIEGSRLLQAGRERLELVRGRALGCEHPRAQPVLAGVAGALAALQVPLDRIPLDGSARGPRGSRLPEPVRVHVDPRLPARQAPLAGIEVHVTTGEVLVRSSALDTLEPEAWRHELFHVLAARPPDMAPISRRLWLTLEEGVVIHLARSVPSEHGAEAARPREVRPEPTSVAPPPLPVLDWLASPAYDPHPLARGLARELDRAEPHPALERWLSCLAASPAIPALGRASGVSPDGPTPHDSQSVPDDAARVFGMFASRCSPDTASLLSAAIGRWWVMPRPDPELLGQGADGAARGSTPSSAPDVAGMPRRTGVRSGGEGSRPVAPHGLMARSVQLSEPR